ncbi:helix-turn-helix transcriptional regulator [Microvirga sp. BT689]|nr:helix-turn-helix transcriptional regulator [Microvirga arvi]
MLAEGASNKLIARRFGIPFHTAKFHVASIAAKLDATGRTDAVAQAVPSGSSCCNLACRLITRRLVS